MCWCDSVWRPTRHVQDNEIPPGWIITIDWQKMKKTQTNPRDMSSYTVQAKDLQWPPPTAPTDAPIGSTGGRIAGRLRKVGRYLADIKFLSLVVTTTAY
jgi:hypothetical protein